MGLPPRYAELIRSDLEPGALYGALMAAVIEDGLALDYASTQTLVYAVEVRYALDILQGGARPDEWWSFGDLHDQDRLLWQTLDRLTSRRVMFVGCGPYPVTALAAADRYGDADVTCIDNDITAYLLARAVAQAVGVRLTVKFEDAHSAAYSGFDAVVVAAMVTGKTQLVRRVLTESRGVVVTRGDVGCSDARLVTLRGNFRDDGTIDGAALYPALASDA